MQLWRPASEKGGPRKGYRGDLRIRFYKDNGIF